MTSRQVAARYALPLIATTLAGVHLLVRFTPGLASSSLMFYGVQPLLWAVPAAFVVWLTGRRVLLTSLDWPVVFLALLVAAIQILTGVLIGAFVGFGHSPYNHSAPGLAKGLWFALSIALFREIARWFIVTRLAHRSELLAVGGTVTLFWLTSVPLAGWGRLIEGGHAFAYTGSVLLPALAASLFATYLAWRSGPLASFAYLGALAAFEWASPILPDLAWPVATIVGVLVPILGFALLEQDDTERDGVTEVADDGMSRTWIVAGLLLLAILWFNTGVFGVRPTLVHGTSMEPRMHTGDVVITREVPLTQLRVGDVIRWDQGNYEVLHRIIEIRTDDGALTFITQGDNNEGPDSPVDASQVEGVLVVHVPNIGLPAIWAKRGISTVLD